MQSEQEMAKVKLRKLHLLFVQLLDFWEEGWKMCYQLLASVFNNHKVVSFLWIFSFVLVRK